MSRLVVNQKERRGREEHLKVWLCVDEAHLNLLKRFCKVLLHLKRACRRLVIAFDKTSGRDYRAPLHEGHIL